LKVKVYLPQKNIREYQKIQGIQEEKAQKDKDEKGIVQ
jgi:hypothetical protein